MSKENVSGFVLAGGKSSRMGRDKALLEIDGESLIARSTRLVRAVLKEPVVIASTPGYGALGLKIVADDFPGYGPLGGIATALHVSTKPWNLVIACDLPYLTKTWLEYLIERALKSVADAVVPMNVRGPEPLCAMYHKSAEARIRTAVEGGMRKVTDSFATLCVEYVEPSEWKGFASGGVLFKNVNSPADYDEAKARLSKQKNS
ncbi:MAG: molybdenum cofactor guanylyltransferase [Candidatus Acidiferrales bacterium]|jgi:molybdopterin-guanine dinucleotide biosynthesis protein A